MSDPGLLEDVAVDPASEEVTNDPTAPHREEDPAPTISHVVEAETESPTSETPAAPTRPEGIPDKFWHDERGVLVEQLAKSYSELEGSFRAGRHKAPKDGAYDTRALEEKLETEAGKEMLTSYTAWAKKYGISQEAYDDLAKDFLAVSTNAADEAPFDREAELKALGPNGQAIVDGTVVWAQGLVKRGVWGAEDFEEFKHFAGTAQGIRAVNKLRRYYGEQPIPIAAAPVESRQSPEELYKMVADPRYGTDTAYRQSVEKAFQDAFGNDPATTPALDGLGMQ